MVQLAALLVLTTLSAPMDGEDAVARARGWLAKVGVRDKLLTTQLSHSPAKWLGAPKAWWVGFRSEKGRTWSLIMADDGTVLKMNSFPDRTPVAAGTNPAIAQDLLQRAAGKLPVRLSNCGGANARFASTHKGKPYFNLNPLWGVLISFDPAKGELLSYLRQTAVPEVHSEQPLVSEGVAKSKLVAWAKSNAKTNTVAGWLVEPWPGLRRYPRIELGYYRFRNAKKADLVYRAQVMQQAGTGEPFEQGPLPVYVDARTGALRDHDDPATGGKR